MHRNHVILVDTNDVELGVMEKMIAHEKGILHRAFSIFIFNDRNELLLQKRAASKYHSPSLWTNTCCSHPQQGENTIASGQLRLQEELGFTVPLHEMFSFIYKAKFANNLIEHELDYVLLGNYNGEPIINTEEVEDWKWMDLEDLKADIKLNTAIYTEWFKIVFDRFYEVYTAKYSCGN
jgi:isopentenyl-diphosphate Delta-isomerase